MACAGPDLLLAELGQQRGRPGGRGEQQVLAENNDNNNDNNNNSNSNINNNNN